MNLINFEVARFPDHGTIQDPTGATLWTGAVDRMHVTANIGGEAAFATVFVPRGKSEKDPAVLKEIFTELAKNWVVTR